MLSLNPLIFQLPLSGSQKLLKELEGRIFDHVAFQLPLSGSHEPASAPLRIDYGSGRELSTPSLGITVSIPRHVEAWVYLLSTPSLGITYKRSHARACDQAPRLSTPSLGITLHQTELLRRERKRFQLPLSGSLEIAQNSRLKSLVRRKLSTPSLGITAAT